MGYKNNPVISDFEIQSHKIKHGRYSVLALGKVQASRVFDAIEAVRGYTSAETHPDLYESAAEVRPVERPHASRAAVFYAAPKMRHEIGEVIDEQAVAAGEAVVDNPSGAFANAPPEVRFARGFGDVRKLAAKVRGDADWNMPWAADRWRREALALWAGDLEAAAEIARSEDHHTAGFPTPHNG